MSYAIEYYQPVVLILIGLSLLAIFSLGINIVLLWFQVVDFWKERKRRKNERRWPMVDRKRLQDGKHYFLVVPHDQVITFRRLVLFVSGSRDGEVVSPDANGAWSSRTNIHSVAGVFYGPVNPPWATL